MFGAEPLDDLVERALHGRQRGKSLDQPVASFDSVAAKHGLAVARDGAR